MRTIGVRLRMETGSYLADTKTAEAATAKLRGTIADTGTKGKADFDRLATGMAVVGTALLGIAGAAVATAAKFDKQMSEVGAVANATAGEMDQLRQAAIDAGQATVFSATEAAQAEAELAKAGIATADILGGALAGSLSLAAAGSLDLATAAEISASAMNTFGLEGAEVEHIADVLAAAANKSAAGVQDLGQGLQQVGLIANQVGFSLEETVGLLAAFADRGLKGSDGATSLKTALMRLAAPTDKAAQVMEELGISMYDSAGQMVGAVEIAGQLQGALADLTPAQRNAALQTMFGSDAIRAANVLYSEGAAGIAGYIAAVDDQGAAAEVAAKKLDNLAGDVEKLTGSLETLAVGGGSGASGGLRTLVQLADKLVAAFAALPGPVQSGAVVIAGVAGAALLAAAGALKLRSALAGVVLEMRKGGPAANRFAGGLETTTKWAARASIALTALTIVDQIAASFRDAEVDTTALAESLDHLAKSGQANTEVVRLFGEDLAGFGEAVRATQGWGADFMKGTEAIPVIGSIFAEGERIASDFNRSTGDSVIVLKALDDQLAAMVREGHTTEALTLVQQLAKANNLMFDEVEAALPGYTAAMINASSTTKDGATAAGEVTEANKVMGESFNDAAGQVGGLMTKFDELNGAAIDWARAEIGVEAALDDMKAALDASNGSMNVHTEEGRAAKSAVLDFAEASATAMQAKIDETASVEEASDVYDHYRGELIDSMVQAGLTKKEAKALADQWLKMPKTVNTKVTVTGIDSALNSYYSMRGIMSQVINVPVRTVQTGPIASARRWGGITEHAADGLLRGASTFTPASPARYAFAEPQTGGEAFVPKRGDYGRSMNILSAAAGWYNADVVPRNGWYGGGGMGGGGLSLTVDVSGATTPYERALAEAMRNLTWKLGGGEVQKAFGRTVISR